MQALLRLIVTISLGMFSQAAAQESPSVQARIQVLRRPWASGELRRMTRTASRDMKLKTSVGDEELFDLDSEQVSKDCSELRCLELREGWPCKIRVFLESGEIKRKESGEAELSEAPALLKKAVVLTVDEEGALTIKGEGFELNEDQELEARQNYGWILRPQSYDFASLLPAEPMSLGAEFKASGLDAVKLLAGRGEAEGAELAIKLLAQSKIGDHAVANFSLKYSAKAELMAAPGAVEIDGEFSLCMETGRVLKLTLRESGKFAGEEADPEAPNDPPTKTEGSELRRTELEFTDRKD